MISLTDPFITIDRPIHISAPGPAAAGPAPVRVLVIAGDPVREDLAALIATHPRLCLAGVASGYRETFASILGCRAQVAVVDTEVDDARGPKLVARLRQTQPELAVIGLGAAADATWIKAMLGNGARGCVTRSAGPERLPLAILAAHAGERYFCPQSIEVLIPTLLA